MSIEHLAVIGAADAIAADGGIIRIRPVAASDADNLRRLYRNASAENLYRRFLTGGGADVEAEVARLTRPDDGEHLALLAVERDEVVGVASFEGVDRPGVAEFAVFVADAQHGRGIGTLLLEHLTTAARRRGYGELVGEVLAANAPMLRVVTDLAPALRARHEGGLVEVHLATAAGEAEAIEERDRRAEHRSLQPLFEPRGVAVIGAGRAPGGVGHETLVNLARGGYAGTLVAVNPNARQVAGVRSYPSIGAVPQPVDLAVIAVPAPVVAATLDECGRAGVRAAVVLSAGFGEAGPAGRVAEAELVRVARRHGMRLVGPNCLGVVNTDPMVALHATFAAVRPGRGGLAVASQSGAVAITILDHAARAGLGLSAFVSLGNKADVSGNDLLAYWHDDPATKVVALYLESIGNPRRFARVARALARRKPVLVVKSGRSAAGRRAGLSHTAAAAAPDRTVDALFAQAGVIRCDSLGDLFDTARLLINQSYPRGHRLAVVGNAGGVNVLAADAAEAYGLEVAAPVDLGAAAASSAFHEAIAHAARDGAVDALLVVFALTGTNDPAKVMAAIGAGLDRVRLPAAVVLLGVPDAPATIGVRRAPVYDLPERAVAALGRAAQYGAWREEAVGVRPDLSDVDEVAARRIVDAALAAGGGWQSWSTAAALLGCYGIPVVETVPATGAADTVAAADRLGYPVVVKAGDPDLIHKSDTGAVRLDLADADAVRGAYTDIAAAVGVVDPPVIVQPQARGEVELVAGVAHDRLFGSVVLLGAGGVLTELLGDRVLRLPPLTTVDAGRMWRSLRLAPLLTGYRGRPGVAIDAVERLLVHLGRLADDLPEVAELDLNPVLAGRDGLAVVDVKLRLARVGAEPDPVRRALREPG
jgi:acyl-CoA synthetase (NDP forming)/GNAT superfamily N-acetyltransferase